VIVLIVFVGVLVEELVAGLVEELVAGLVEELVAALVEEVASDEVAGTVSDETVEAEEIMSDEVSGVASDEGSLPQATPNRSVDDNANAQRIDVTFFMIFLLENMIIILTIKGARRYPACLKLEIISLRRD
jgi:hypothetical protein